MKAPYDFEWNKLITYPGIMPNMYEISNYGKVYNIVNDFEVSQHKARGYYRVALMTQDQGQNCYLVHRLVAWEWVPYRCDLSLQINHKDGIKTNNYYENLEWVTSKENIQHAWNNGLATKTTILIGEEASGSKLTSDEVHFICQERSRGVRGIDIAEQFKGRISSREVHSILRGECWNHIVKQYLPFPPIDYRGTNATNVVLTNDEVHFICQEWLKGTSTKELEKILNYKVSEAAIRAIVKGRRWTNISSQYGIQTQQRVYK